MDGKKDQVMVRLGSTGIEVNKNGFGALPIQRISDEEAVYLLKKPIREESVFLIRREDTATVNINWDWRLKKLGNPCLLLQNLVP